jgi:hypothetical protein
MLAGFDGASQTLAPNSAAAYVPLKSFEERAKLGVTVRGHHGRGAAPHLPTSTRRACSSSRRRSSRASARRAATA